MNFDLRKLLIDVFDPQPGELVTVGCDVPHRPDDDTAAWRDRRDMAAEWRGTFEELGRERGFEVNPLLTYAATGAGNAELPREARLGDAAVELEQALLGSTLAAFLTQYSATAPLDALTRRKEDFRAASMPGIERRMERTALSADYSEVARRCRILDGLLRGAAALDVRFSTGHACHFDLRYRHPEVDDGWLPRFKSGDRVINLPSGEAFIVPYEGERDGEPSETAGEIPVVKGGEQLVLRVERNRIVEVIGEGGEAHAFAAFFAADPMRANIAEVAFGCNERAEVTGNVLEDEKAGFHWAYGRSEHLGGTVGPAAFRSREMVIHHDIVYAHGNPIQVAEASVRREGGTQVVIRDGEYLVF